MDKQKQIEEMAIANMIQEYLKNNDIKVSNILLPLHIEDMLIRNGYRKIPEWAVFLTSEEYQRYERIEKIIKLSKMEKANGYEVKNGKLYYFSNMLGGCEIEFKDLQEICDMANYYNEGFWDLDQQLTFWKSKAEETRKETAEKFAERVKMAFYYEFDEIIPSIMSDKIDEILKELQEC